MTSKLNVLTGQCRAVSEVGPPQLAASLVDALFLRKPAIALTGLGHRVLPYLDDIARSADCAREVARTLTPRPDADRSARQAADSSHRIDAADARQFAQVGLRRTAACSRNGVLR
jgi:hypothetical protein